MDVTTDKTKELQVAASSKITELVNESLKHKRSVLLMLSGGSNIQLLDLIDTSNFNKYVTITTVDERFTTNRLNNNMAQIKKTNFYKKCNLQKCNFIDTEITENITDANRFSNDLNDSLANWLNNNPNGVIVMTIGIGTDGHTSGMKPMDKNDFKRLFLGDDPNKFITYYDASKVDPDNPKRITTNLNFFKTITKTAKIVVYAIGKKDIVKKVKSNIGSVNTTPALILNEMREVYYFTD